jgi:transposase
MEKRIAFLHSQQKEIESEIKSLINDHAAISKIAEHLSSIPGIGTLTLATILGETNGFELIRNKRQLTSYAGLDVKDKQSGTSVKGKSCISKRGNKYLRKAMYLPSLTAIRWNKNYKAIYDRLVVKHGLKMKAIVAIQRKLLELTFTIYKKQEDFDPDFEENEKRQSKKNDVKNINITNEAAA